MKHLLKYLKAYTVSAIAIIIVLAAQAFVISRFRDILPTL